MAAAAPGTVVAARIASDQLLLASSTTEGGAAAMCATAKPHRAPRSRIGLVRDATVISYGAEADAIVTTARRADGASSDQVLVVFQS